MKLKAILLSVIVLSPILSYAANIQPVSFCISNIGTGIGAKLVVGSSSKTIPAGTNYSELFQVPLGTTVTVYPLTKNSKFGKMLPPVTENVAYQIIPGPQLIKQINFKDCPAAS